MWYCTVWQFTIQMYWRKTTIFMQYSSLVMQRPRCCQRPRTAIQHLNRIHIFTRLSLSDSLTSATKKTWSNFGQLVICNPSNSFSDSSTPDITRSHHVHFLKIIVHLTFRSLIISIANLPFWGMRASKHIHRNLAPERVLSFLWKRSFSSTQSFSYEKVNFVKLLSSFLCT